MFVKSAVLVNINSREHNSLSNFIPLAILESLDSDVKITLDIEYEKMETNLADINAYICACNSKWRELDIKVENSSPMPWWSDGRHYDLGSKSFPDKFIFTLPKSEIERLDVNGLAFKSNNLYIKTATLEKA